MSEKYIGETVGIFEIIERMNYKDNDGHALYKGACKECGFTRIARINDFKNSVKCTHIRIDGQIVSINTDWDNERIRIIFNSMKRRCYNKNNKDYRWYGANGIKICDEWMNNPKSFEEWAMQNGYEDNLTIDRIYGNKDYCPENCRWVTNKDNSKYKTTTSMICVNGEIHSGRDWARKLGIGINLINNYVKKYGLDNTVKFIEKYLKNPKMKPKSNQSYYDLYMCQ